MVESKQIKVDNWGIFFLQRLQQFYNKSTYCDLTLLFDDHVRIRVHRLVLNACTEYFSVLEKTCPIDNDCLRMPSNLPSEILIPIINFMYSGILDLNESSFDRLYSTAKLMNMSVLTKLLDAQKTPIKPPQKRIHATPISWHQPVKRITKQFIDSSDLPEQLPGRKLPIWRRKSIPTSLPYLGSSYESFTPTKKFVSDEPPKPTRFDWPDEENSFDTAFDDISYESKPLILPTYTEKPDPAPKPGPSTNTFEEIKKTAVPVKRSASPIGNQCKKVNLQDVKEYLKEHKIRSDYIEYEDSEAADNDLQSYENEDSNDDKAEDTPNKSILKNEGVSPATPSNKHVRFSLEEDESEKGKHVKFSLESEESDDKKKVVKTEQDMSKHTKIIAEVLKKYPHLVKNNKNIRLKILAKGNGAPTAKSVVAKAGTAKPGSKVSYMVVKPEEKTKSNQNPNEKEHICTRCEKPQTFLNYLTYRQHLTDVHNEKQDSQMCMICGHVSRKQNMLVYHKFIKHNIQPPAMYNFPKCTKCSYIAISPIVLQKHMTTHTNQKEEQYVCKYCDKKFVLESVYNNHVEQFHRNELEESPLKKEKIKILSDVKVSTAIQTEIKPEIPTEPSSEAEALSNVASGIAASLGLVDTIVVLDDNQFILQSQGGQLQQNIINDGQEYIIPDMQLDNISTSTVSQMTQPTVTLSDGNVLTQSLHKTGITSTDELVMVLTDHDYGDGNNAVITDNNIVVLYSHPVQTQAGTMMLTSEGNMIQVDNNYAKNIPVTIAQGNCEESIEMIQQEINNQLDTTSQEGQSSDMVQQPNYIEIKQESSSQVVEIQNATMEMPQEANYEVNILQSAEATQEENVIPEESIGGIEEGMIMEQAALVEESNQIDQTEGQMDQTEENVSQMDENMAQIEAQLEESDPTIESNQIDEMNQMEAMNQVEEMSQMEEMPQIGENEGQIEENLGEVEHVGQEEFVDQMEESMTQIECPQVETMSQNETEENLQSQEDLDQFQEVSEVSQVEENQAIGEDVVKIERLSQSEAMAQSQEMSQLDEMAQSEEVPQFEETSTQIQEFDDVPNEATAEESQSVEESSEPIPTDQLIQSENEENVAPFQMEEMSEMDQNQIISNESQMEVEENLEMNQEVEQIEEMYQNEENVPYNQERLIDETMGDIPQIEENLHHDEVGTNIEQVEEASGLEQIETNYEKIEEISKECTIEESDTVATGDTNIEATQIEEEPKIQELISNEDNLAPEPNVKELRNQEMEVDQEDSVLGQNEEMEITSEKLNEEMAANENETSVETRKDEEVIKTPTENVENVVVKHDRISKILDDWDDGDTDSQQSNSKTQVIEEKGSEEIVKDENPNNSIKTLIDDWEEDED